MLSMAVKYVLLSVTIFPKYAECHNAKCHRAVSHGAGQQELLLILTLGILTISITTLSLVLSILIAYYYFNALQYQGAIL
jgi:hypothetical protein